MPSGSRYAGQPADASTRRSVELQLQSGRSDLIRAEDRHAVVDYFYHEGRFWRAFIPLDGVDAICGQAFNFSSPRTRRGKNGREIRVDKHGLPKRTNPLLNHVQSRFQLKSDQPVELYPLGSDASGDPDHRLHDLVYSLEAVGPIGVFFNFRDAIAGNLLSAHRFLSTREMVFERIVVGNEYVVETPPLPLDERDKRALLVESLVRSHRAAMSEVYYLYRCCGTNNCTSNPLQILDKVVDYGPRQRIGASFFRLPLSPRIYLRARGMDADPTVRKLVRNEFEEYIQDPDTRKRKREFVRHHARLRRAARRDRERQAKR